MSTKNPIKWKEAQGDLPGFQVYTDVTEEWGLQKGQEAPVYLQLEGVAVQLETLAGGGATVSIRLPAQTARELGLIPKSRKNPTNSSTPLSRKE